VHRLLDRQAATDRGAERDAARDRARRLAARLGVALEDVAYVIAVGAGAHPKPLTEYDSHHRVVDHQNF